MVEDNVISFNNTGDFDPGWEAGGAKWALTDGLVVRALVRASVDAQADLEAAAELYTSVGAELDLARALVDLGARLRRRRQPTAARVPLRRALDLASRCGAAPLAATAEHELRATGARPRRARTTGPDALTSTEQRVAELATKGLSNRQIAETLYVSRKTVETHLEHVFRKLDIRRRADLEQALTTAGT